MLGSRGDQRASRTVWNMKGSSARIDVENPNPGKRPGSIHYQDENNVKYQYSVDQNKFYKFNPSTKQFDSEAPKSVNKLLKNESFQKGINKALKYLGEEPKFKE